ncbi:nucleoside recognition family protein [Caballeronia mineralivorans PML1(12)]|uniref:Nucleoside recognition family protein n=1 Tax=Caballeronia mineralivorans PML1(12) TaxID=908627 RepID=A0A0J1FLM1_9BURK|nr:nucleoside recognition domain-containing protein [Caballeronia mineralivorans]KLU20598.1 nucleoside recognition family protein [Caballeronia mineralivorans PML1(12)]
MEGVVEVVLHAGRDAVDVSLYTLLPIMVVMMILLRLLEASGILDRVIRLVSPLAKPFGLTGIAVLAMVQISFVSFVAPLPTLALMEDRGTSDRHLAAALAAVLAMAPANALFPLAVLGLHSGETLLLSALGGLAAASVTYWLLGRCLSNTTQEVSNFERQASGEFSLLNISNVSGAEAIQIVINIIPMLLVSLVVTALQQVGAVHGLESLLAPALARIGVEPAFILPILTKYLAGSTALVGVVHDMSARGHLVPAVLSAGGAGFLLHPLDLPGLAILLSAGRRIRKTAIPTVVGGCIGIALRTVLGIAFG